MTALWDEKLFGLVFGPRRCCHPDGCEAAGGPAFESVQTT